MRINSQAAQDLLSESPGDVTDFVLYFNMAIVSVFALYGAMALGRDLARWTLKRKI